MSLGQEPIHDVERSICSTLSDSEIGQLNDLENFLRFKRGTVFDCLVHLRHKFKALFCGNQFGKCLDEDSLVHLADGSMKKIKNIEPGDVVLSVDEKLKIVSNAVVEKVNSGTRQCVRVTTRNGARIVCSIDHPFLTVDGWKKLDAIGIGGYIGVPRHLCFSSSEAKESEAILAGYLIGDGGLTSGGVRDEKMMNLGTSDVFWDKVERIERVGRRKTYDLHIENAHNFVANGIFAHNTALISYQYVLRFLNIHPIPELNPLYFKCPNGHAFYDSVLRCLVPDGPDRKLLRPEDNICTICGKKLSIHERNTHTYRIMSENLPVDTTEGQSGDGEIKNSTYPALKKWLPAFLVKKDIVARNPSIRLHNVNANHWFGDLYYRGEDIIVEFMSYNQSVQAGAGVQRLSVFFDEEPPYAVYEEQLPRLLAEDGDVILGLTPANGLSWTYDEVYERGKVYIRTPAVCDFMNSQGSPTKQVTITENKSDVAVIQAATDDNPTLTKEAIERIYDLMDDEDMIATRRYGIHKQSSGRIFKDFDSKVHIIDPGKYFPSENGHKPFGHYSHVRLIDYHQHNPWAVLWVALSQQNELFVYEEWNPSPDKFVTRAIAARMATMSGDTRFRLNLIDPLANTVQVNTGTTTVQDLNIMFNELKREGIGSGGAWSAWDTKSTRGRDALRERLKNSLRCGIPFNNHTVADGRAQYMPTVWFFNNCRECIRHMSSWRLEEWASSRNNTNKDKKETPSQKFSHFPMCLEAVLKDNRFRPPLSEMDRIERAKAPHYMKSVR